MKCHEDTSGSTHVPSFECYSMKFNIKYQEGIMKTLIEKQLAPVAPLGSQWDITMKLKKFVTCMKQKKRGLGSVVFMFATLLLQACLAISTPFIKATKTTSNVIHILFARLTQCVVELVSICFGLLARSRPSICSMPVSFPRRCSGTLYYSQH